MPKKRTYIGIDPATKTGFALPGNSGFWDLKVKTEAKSLGRKAEPRRCRPGKLFVHLDELRASLGKPEDLDIVLVCEGAAAFTRGKAAVRLSHELRGAVQTWCWVNDVTYVEIEPQDLKKFASGKGNTPKEVMVEIARSKYKPDCTNDDEADALHLLAWAQEHYQL